MSLKTAAFLLLSFGTSAAFAADKHPWASFKPGSYAKLKSTTAAGTTRMTTEMKQTLVGIDANNAVIEVETKVAGQSNKTRTNVALKADGKANATAQGKAPTPTNETITVAGKALACKCYEVESNANGMKSSSRTCTSEAVPGGVVKSVTKMTGAGVKSETTMELVDFVVN